LLPYRFGSGGAFRRVLKDVARKWHGPQVARPASGTARKWHGLLVGRAACANGLHHHSATACQQAGLRVILGYCRAVCLPRPTDDAENGPCAQRSHGGIRRGVPAALPSAKEINQPFTERRWRFLRAPVGPPSHNLAGPWRVRRASCKPLHDCGTPACCRIPA